MTKDQVMVEQIETIRKKILRSFHKTRLTEDIRFSLTVEETQDLLVYLEGKK